VVRTPFLEANVLLHFSPTAPRSAMRLRVHPATIEAGRRTRVQFQATHGGLPVAGAVVRLADRWVRTGADGSARITVRFRRAGRRRVIASRADPLPATAAVRVRGS
jgi:hypothetical protein